MGNLARKLQREKKRNDDKETKIAERTEAENHPAAKYTEELIAEIEGMHKKYPEVQMIYKTQIDLIRTACETKVTALRTRKKEIIDEILKKTENIIRGVEQDYLDKEVWQLMRTMELERDEIKDIIKNHYGEETKTN